TLVLIIRLAMVTMLGLVIVITLASPVQSAIARYNRLLLLPISRETLHIVEVVANLTDPWIGFLVPGLFMLSVVFLAGRRPDAALTSLVASTLMMATLALVGALMGFLVGWLFRSRRRGELFTLVFVLALSMLGFVPAMFSRDLDARKKHAAPAADE